MAAALLRALHTLKGNSGMLGYAAIRDYVHDLETIFKAPPAAWSQSLLDLLFEGAATLRRAVEQVGRDDEAAAFERLASLPPLEVTVATAPAPVVPQAHPGTRSPEVAPARAARSADEPAEPEPVEVGVSTELLRVPFTKLDALANLVVELFGIHARLDDLLAANRAALHALELRRPLQTMTGQLERVAGGLRDAATDLRMVPVGRVFSRFPSLGRDLAREQGKQVHVVIEGEETGLDKSTVDILAEPLLHLVRNAVDHGIRTPDEREAAGKPPHGTVTLRASQSGDSVRIEVEDDGTGLDRERILERARAAGLVAANEELTDTEVAELIFRPGFSTRQQADTVSGRGIGMDVVATSVARLRGRLEVEDLPGAGTRFILHLPLTVAMLPVIVFVSAGETLALPALEVEDTRRLGRVSWVAGAEMLEYEDEMIPLARPERLFGWTAPATGNGDDPGTARPRYVMVIRRGSRAAAVTADRLLDQRDVVVKALPAYLGHPPAVSGATIAPDGRVILLLDAGGMIDLNLDTYRRTRRVETTG